MASSGLYFYEVIEQGVWSVALHHTADYKSWNYSIYQNMSDNQTVEKCLVAKWYQKQPSPFLQMQICFLIKRKIENWQIYGQAYISMVW